MRNMRGGRDDRLEEGEEQINDLENRVVESNQAEQKRETRIMQKETRLRELSDSAKCNNIHIIEVPEEKREKRGQNIYLKK